MKGRNRLGAAVALGIGVTATLAFSGALLYGLFVSSREQPFP